MQQLKKKDVSVASLHLDRRNPRLGRDRHPQAPREIIEYLFIHDKAMDVAESIATRGYFPNEPLLVVEEQAQLIVVEGNRRLAALKGLNEPGLLAGALSKKLQQLSRRIPDLSSISTVPVVIAPNRKATDRQVAGRHVGTSVLPWEKENRASFILEKLAEGYTNDSLRDDLGFSLADIQRARQTRSIAEMARSLPLSDEVKAKLDNPRAKIFSTLERVVDSTVGKEFLGLVGNAEHGLKGVVPKSEFIKGFSKLVSDIALGKQSSRSLNKSEDIQNYFEAWDKDARPAKKRGSFVPADIVVGKSGASPLQSVDDVKKAKSITKSKVAFKTVIPKTFKVRVDSPRLIEIRDELVRLSRHEFPNAGAMLLRAFFELSAVNFLERRGMLPSILLQNNKTRDRLALKDIIPPLLKIAEAEIALPRKTLVAKAIQYNKNAPFTITDLHSFIHNLDDFPNERDIIQFWKRTEPLFQLMLEDGA